jgi:Protein of unknown function, DUF547
LKKIVLNQILIIISLWLLTVGSAWSQFDHSHTQWSALLKKHVVVLDGGKASQLRYAGMAAERAALKTYLDALAKVSEADFKGWTKNQQLAFLINAYNANMVEKILLRYPNIKSVWDYGKLIGNPFKDNFVSLFGRKMTLDNIEHDTIRAKGVHDDPRIHFAVNCASVGCPMLREEAYVAERLDAQLEEQAVRFVSDKSRNRYSAAANALEVSEIFKWYAVDFTSGLKGIKSREQFFAKYASLLSDNAEHQKLIRDGKAEIKHLDYDWGLNDARK